MILELQIGHTFGFLYLIPLLFFLSFMTSITCGMTSPARSTITLSPSRISFFSISSKLCNVAFETITPPIFTGISLATGVTEPVLPI